MITALEVFVAVILAKLLINASRYLECRRLLKKYEQCILTRGRHLEVEEESQQIVALFRHAGITEPRVPFAQPVGYGQIKTGEVSVFENIASTREDVFALVIRAFHRAKGVYRSRIIEAINPVYWIETVIFLPQRALAFLGLAPETVFARIAQFAYWVLTVAVGLLYGLCRPQIEQLVKYWLGSLAP